LCQANFYTTTYSAVKGFFGKTRKIIFLRSAGKLEKDKQLVTNYRRGTKITAGVIIILFKSTLMNIL